MAISVLGNYQLSSDEGANDTTVSVAISPSTNMTWLLVFGVRHNVDGGNSTGMSDVKWNSQSLTFYGAVADTSGAGCLDLWYSSNPYTEASTLELYSDDANSRLAAGLFYLSGVTGMSTAFVSDTYSASDIFSVFPSTPPANAVCIQYVLTQGSNRTYAVSDTTHTLIHSTGHGFADNRLDYSYGGAYKNDADTMYGILAVADVTAAMALWLTAGTIYTSNPTASLGTAGTIIKQAGKAVAGEWLPTGTVTKSLSGRVISGALTMAGTVVKKIPRTFVGSMATAGTVVKKAKKTLAGVLSSVGNVFRDIILRKVVTMWTQPSGGSEVELDPSADVDIDSTPEGRVRMR